MAHVLHADYDTSQTALHSTDRIASMTFVRDHHRAAKIVPDLSLQDHWGNVLASMHRFATDWTDAFAEPDA